MLNSWRKIMQFFRKCAKRYQVRKIDEIGEYISPIQQNCCQSVKDLIVEFIVEKYTTKIKIGKLQIFKNLFLLGSKGLKELQINIRQIEELTNPQEIEEIINLAQFQLRRELIHIYWSIRQQILQYESLSKEEVNRIEAFMSKIEEKGFLLKVRGNLN